MSIELKVLWVLDHWLLLVTTRAHAILRRAGTARSGMAARAADSRHVRGTSWPGVVVQGTACGSAFAAILIFRSRTSLDFIYFQFRG